jgi:hypothetical protein
MQHIERSGWRRGQYTALAGTAATLARYRITRTARNDWRALPDTLYQGGKVLYAPTLRKLDAMLVGISRDV